MVARSTSSGGGGERAQLIGRDRPARAALGQLRGDDLRVQRRELQPARLLVAVEDRADPADLRDGAAGLGDDFLFGELLRDRFKQAGLRAGRVQCAGVVGGFERAAEGAGEDGQRAGDGEQQHRAGRSAWVCGPGTRRPAAG